MALSDFFPYGAPELLEGAPARMARSTMTASLAVALLVAMGGALLSRQVAVAIEPELLRDPFDFTEVNVILPKPEVNTGAVPPAKFIDPYAIPEIVPETMDRDPEIVGPNVPEGPIGDRTDAGPPARTGGEVIAPVRDPDAFEFVAVDELPAPVRCADARYPEFARQAGIEGTVHVRMLVGLDGKVERAIIAPKGSVPMLDQAALDAALTCVFTPALASGHPVKVWVSQSYRFKLH